MGSRRGAYRVLVGKPEGKRQLRRRRFRQDNITMDLEDIERGRSVDLVHDRNKRPAVVNKVMNLLKVKVKLSLERAMKVQRGSRGIAVLFL